MEQKIEKLQIKNLEVIKQNMLSLGIDETTFTKEAGFACQIWNNPKNSYLRKSTKESLLTSLLNIARVGLTLNPVSKEAYLIPRYNSTSKKVECHLEPSYIGLTKLLTDTGNIRMIQTNLIYDGDTFEVLLGTKTEIKHIPYYANKKDKGEIVGVYSIATLNTGEIQYEHMIKSDVDEIRNKSESYKAFKDGKTRTSIWNDFESEMIRKTCLKRIYKYLPRSEKNEYIDNAIELSNIDYMASSSQIGYIDRLLTSCSLNEEEIVKIESELPSLSFDGAGKLISHLKENQLNNITEGTGYSQSDIQKEIDIKMKSEKS